MFRETYLNCARTFNVESGLALPEEQLRQAETRLNLNIPEALREFYLTLGAWDLNVAHNRLVSPAELSFKGNHLVFYEENEGQACWGIARDQLNRPDPVVMQGVKQGRRWDWYEEELSCAPFLVLMTLWQTLAGGLGFASIASVDGVFTDLKPGWKARGNNGPMSIYTKPGAVLGVLYDEEEDATSLHAAATSDAALEAIHDEYEELPWELITGEDDADE
jgi:hypothetical protein